MRPIVIYQHTPTHTHQAVHPKIGGQFIAAAVLKPVANKKAAVKLALARIDAAQMLIDRFGCKQFPALGACVRGTWWHSLVVMIYIE
jgi:hypothetical protein